ncbi:MAG: DNA repair protein RadC [Bacteroidetes bacterium]|nr:DNA repair protein RadC [Bacteroidota bacterium]
MEEVYKHISMKFLAEDDRPREKLATLGRHNLSDAELLAIILGSGNRHETAVQLAQRMLSDNNNSINALAKLGLSELKKYKGVGEAKAVNIAAAFEVGRRRTGNDGGERVKITSSKIAYEIIQKFLSDLPHEEFWILILNRANKVVKEECISKGGISSTVVDARLICKSAIENNASAIILAHNHPSGQLIPSIEDKTITKKISEALRLFDIALLDHIIVGDQNYYSFGDEGIL